MKKLVKHILFLLISLCSTTAMASDFSTFADLFYWRASEETGSSWASDVTTPRPGDLTFTPESVNFDKRPGFRIGMIYQPPSFWDTKLYWTHYFTKTSSDAARGAQIIVPEFFSGFLSGDLFFGGAVNWQIAMNTIDLEAGHQFTPIRSLAIRPSIGVKGAMINQTINTTLDAVIYTATERAKNDFRGIGPTLGLAASWNIYDSLNLVGSFSAAYMWGSWNANDTYQRPSALGGLITPTTITTNMNNSQLGTMMFDYFVGFELLHPQKSRYSINLGYEMQSWSNQLRLTVFQILPVRSDLIFQGAICRLKIDL